MTIYIIEYNFSVFIGSGPQKKNFHAYFRIGRSINGLSSPTRLGVGQIGPRRVRVTSQV